MLHKLMFETEGNMEYHLKYFLENGQQRYSEPGLSADSLVESMIAFHMHQKNTYLEKSQNFLWKTLHFRSYQPKNLMVVENTPLPPQGL